MPYKADPHLIPVMENLGVNNLSRNDTPVSSVRLASECLSQGEKRVSCSSGGGDSPQYSWTLDGRSLTDTELLSVNTKTNSITLRQHVSGAVACSVENNFISRSFDSFPGFTFIKCTSKRRRYHSGCLQPIICCVLKHNTSYHHLRILHCGSLPARMCCASSCGLETYCDGRQDGAQCFGPLGGTVVLQLIDRASRTHRYKLYKLSNKTTLILNVINNKQIRSSFNPSDGKFRVNNLSRTDSAEYKFEISDGINFKEKRALRLTIQAPVSSVWLASECLSQGEKRVSCSSGGGDSPQYSWTLGGRSLTDTELLSVNSTETNSITLRQHVSGAVACSVRNNVSQVSKGEEISNCGFIFINCSSNGTQISQWVFAANNTLCIEPTTSPTISTVADHSLLVCAVRAAVVVFAFIGIAVYFAWKKKKYKKAEGLETHCDGRQDGAQCFGPLGGTVVLQLIDRALQTKIQIVQIVKQNNTNTYCDKQ
ncbi:hypothetical protein F7725_010028 [Dissostichus mawsoni]|uniref:Ig-like domain-containing protein n=1 Tax=Dissostichus mawsoni TaxID=36200 RepID=A0A7J5XMN4_DISMA|nr:hypothetical protein F7725_010028 [Dissostichus mawsoni]